MIEKIIINGECAKLYLPSQPSTMVKKAAESENRKNGTEKKKKSFDGRSRKMATRLLADNHLVEYHMADHQIFGQPPFGQPPFANHHLANMQLPTFIWLTLVLADIIFQTLKLPTGV